MDIEAPTKNRKILKVEDLKLQDCHQCSKNKVIVNQKGEVLLPCPYCIQEKNV